MTRSHSKYELQRFEGGVFLPRFLETVFTHALKPISGLAEDFQHAQRREPPASNKCFMHCLTCQAGVSANPDRVTFEIHSAESEP